MGKKKINYLSTGGSMDEKNRKASFHPETPEENYEFNTKSEIPKGMKIGFEDGNPKNQRFANLILVSEGDKEIKDAKKLKEAEKEIKKQKEDKKKDDKKDDKKEDKKEDKKDKK